MFSGQQQKLVEYAEAVMMYCKECCVSSHTKRNSNEEKKTWFTAKLRKLRLKMVGKMETIKRGKVEVKQDDKRHLITILQETQTSFLS